MPNAKCIMVHVVCSNALLQFASSDIPFEWKGVPHYIPQLDKEFHVEHTFKTKLNKDDVNSTTTVATVDWTGVTTEELQKLALKSVVIEQQAIYRISGKIPATDTIKVKELLSKTRQPFVATPESLAARASKMSKEEKEALIAKLMEQV